MNTANAQGPARSPTVLDTFRPDSAKAEAHWLIPSSLAPEQIISSANSQKSFCFIRSLIGSPSPSSTSLRTGTNRKKTALQAGSTAHRQASRRQL